MNNPLQIAAFCLLAVFFLSLMEQGGSHRENKFEITSQKQPKIIKSAKTKNKLGPISDTDLFVLWLVLSAGFFLICLFIFDDPGWGIGTFMLSISLLGTAFLIIAGIT